VVGERAGGGVVGEVERAEGAEEGERACALTTAPTMTRRRRR
jgi:hypothetical protein